MHHHTTPNDIKQKLDDITTPKAPNQPLTIPPDHPLVSRLHEAILACFINAQASYITKYSHNTISLNLKRVAIKQRLENSANQTATLLAAEQHAPPKTITAVIDKQIKNTQQNLQKRLQSLESQLNDERSKQIRLEHISQCFTPPNRTASNPTPHTNNDGGIQLVKDSGAMTAGATPKKSAIRWSAPANTPPTQQYYTHQPRQHNPPQTRGRRNTNPSHHTENRNNDTRRDSSRHSTYQSRNTSTTNYNAYNTQRTKWNSGQRK